MLYTKQESKDCVAHSDTDWVGDLDDCKSTSGYPLQMCGGAVTWRSKKQSLVALSTAKDEIFCLLIIDIVDFFITIDNREIL